MQRTGEQAVTNHSKLDQMMVYREFQCQIETFIERAAVRGDLRLAVKLQEALDELQIVIVRCSSDPDRAAAH